MSGRKNVPQHGFSLPELLVCMVVLLVITAWAAPNFLTQVHQARVRGALSDFSGLMQQTRIRAVQDDRYYSIYLVPGAGDTPQQAYIDIYPQNADGTSGSGAGNGPVENQGPPPQLDPVVPINGEVNPQPAGNAPNTVNLTGQFLPPNSGIVPLDGNTNQTPATFSPRGLPCLPTPAGATFVCDSAGGPQAYWLFFQGSVSQEWGAITVSPAGRIRRWRYGTDTGVWAPL